LDGFFINNQLWISSTSWLVKLRLIIWFLIGNLAFRE
jgi:hypothetical protein